MKIILLLLFYFRYLWTVPLGCIYWIYYAFRYATDKQAYNAYHINKALFDSSKRLTSLIYYFNAVYKYKYDGPDGILDHNNSDMEFFIGGGDCEDVAFRAYRKLKFFGYSPQLIFMKGDKLTEWHMDVYYHVPGNGCYMFNFGSPVIGRELAGCMENLRNIFQWSKIDYVIVRK